jgi:uncharacterized protein YPO0396
MAGTAWFAWDADERRDARRVRELETRAREVQQSNNPIVAMSYWGKADELRAKWNQPRQRFDSRDLIRAELRAVVQDLGIVDPTDAEAVQELVDRAVEAARALDSFASDALESSGSEAEA